MGRGDRKEITMSEFKDFSPEQKEKYLGSLNSCPACGSDEIEWGDFDTTSSTQVCQKVQCLVCDAAWFDIYNLVGVEKLKSSVKM